MPENPEILSNKDVYNEQVVNELIHFASKKEVSVKISNVNIKDSTVINNVTVSLSKSYEFQELIEKEKNLEELFSLLPEESVEKRLEISSKINHQKGVTRKFVQDILTLAEQFNRININTDRLKRAQEFFNSGEFSKARAVLETELEQMTHEQSQLLVKRNEYETETLPKLKANSEEFLILALSTRFDYANKNRFADSRRYFELSIKSYKSKANVFEYAKFLEELRGFDEAEGQFEAYLNEFNQELSLYERGLALKHLANIHQSKNENEKALKEYQEVLDICRRMSEDASWGYFDLLLSTTTQLANLSSIMNLDSDAGSKLEVLLSAQRIIARDYSENEVNLVNLATLLDYSGVFHWRANEYEKATKAYEEALEIKRKLAKENPSEYLPYVATTLNNFASLHLTQKEYELALSEYEEALRINRECAVDNPSVYLSQIALVLNNLANLHSRRNELEVAAEELKEALAIKRNLVKTGPTTYLPGLADTLITLGNVHKDMGHYESALAGYEEALEIYRKCAVDNPSTYLPDVALTLNNIGNAYVTMGAQDEKINEIFRSVGKDRLVSDDNVKRLQNNLSKYAPISREETLKHIEQNFDKRVNADASINYENASRAYEEALAIYRKFAESNPSVYLPYFVITLNHLGLLHAATNREKEAIREFEQVLEIRRKLAINNPSVYLSDVAKSLSLLGLLREKQNKLKESIAELGEALNIRVKLFEDILKTSHEHPLTQSYGEAVVESLNDVALFFQQSMPNRDWSIGYALNAWVLAERITRNQTDKKMALLSTSTTILQDWGLSSNEISNLIAAQVKSVGINPRYYGVNIPQKSSFRFWKIALLIGFIALILYLLIRSWY